jgi:hypothetical protein
VSALVTTACAAGSTTEPTDPANATGAPDTSLPPLVGRLLADRPAPAVDVVEVWVCEVPADTTADLYGDLPLRQPLTADGIVERIAAPVARHLDELSHGAATVELVAGGTVAMGRDDTDLECVEAALAASRPDALAVLAVATAEHVEGEPGGWGRPGSWLTCDGTCPARLTGRAAYVGASDFHPGWGPVPLLDLVLHEYLHTLGLPHSGTSTPGDDEYPSALDVMSDSAAPRAVDPARRDAASTLAVNLLDLGWLDLDAAVTARTGDRTEVDLAPAAGDDGTRLLVLPVDEHRIVTVELRTADGLDTHLPESGVAVHVVDDRAGEDVLRVQLPVHTTAEPFTDLLGPGEALDVEGWRIEVRSVGDVGDVGDVARVVAAVAAGAARLAPATTER